MLLAKLLKCNRKFNKISRLYKGDYDMDSDILTADDLALGDEMFVEYGKKNNLSNEQNAFIDLWSAKDRIDEKQTKLLKTLIKVYRQEKRLKNAKLKSNSEYQRNKKQQIKNDKERAYKLLKLIDNLSYSDKFKFCSNLILKSIDDSTGYSDAVDLLFKSEHEKRDFLVFTQHITNDKQRSAIAQAVELTLAL
jgi:esterase/lipase